MCEGGALECMGVPASRSAPPRYRWPGSGTACERPRRPVIVHVNFVIELTALITELVVPTHLRRRDGGGIQHGREEFVLDANCDRYCRQTTGRGRTTASRAPAAALIRAAPTPLMGGLSNLCPSAHPATPRDDPAGSAYPESV